MYNKTEKNPYVKEDILETPGFIDSKFRLAILAAKRAKQLVNGARKKIDISAENPLTIALREIQNGKISFQIYEEEEYNALRAESSSEEDILEALGEVELDDEYEEIDAAEEAEEVDADDDEEDDEEDADDEEDDDDSDEEEDREDDDDSNEDEED